MASFDDFLNAFEAGVRDLAKEVFSDFTDEALAASKAFVEEIEADLKKWTEQLADHKISQDELEFLIKGKADLLKVHSLTQIGLAKVAVDKFKKDLIDLLIRTAFDTFG